MDDHRDGTARPSQREAVAAFVPQGTRPQPASTTHLAPDAPRRGVARRPAQQDRNDCEPGRLPESVRLLDDIQASNGLVAIAVSGTGGVNITKRMRQQGTVSVVRGDFLTQAPRFKDDEPEASATDPPRIPR